MLEGVGMGTQFQTEMAHTILHPQAGLGEEGFGAQDPRGIETGSHRINRSLSGEVCQNHWHFIARDCHVQRPGGGREQDKSLGRAEL